MYKGKGRLFNAAVRAWTGSQYSHCELVVGDWCYSSSLMDGGVRRKKIDLLDGKWNLFDLPGVSAESVEDYFLVTDHHRYGLLSLLTSQIFNRGQSMREAQFCSEWCANALGIPRGVIYSPVAVKEVALWHFT
jgi:hypothetical protein